MATKRDAWSAYLRRMTGRPGWTVARLARESGIARSSIFRWIAEGGEGITIESVYRIADAFGEDRAEALHAAGNMPERQVDEEIALILASEFPEATKTQMIERLVRRRQEERERRMEDLRWLLEAQRDGKAAG